VEKNLQNVGKERSSGGARFWDKPCPGRKRGERLLSKLNKGGKGVNQHRKAKKARLQTITDKTREAGESRGKSVRHHGHLFQLRSGGAGWKGESKAEQKKNR